MKNVLYILASLIFFSSCMKKEDFRIDISYTGEELRYIQCPLGGVGTGNLLINGYGSIREIEVFNRASRDEFAPEMTFFALYTREEGEKSVCRIMESESLDEYPNPFGKPRQQLGGLPRFREAVFHNAYPMISIDLLDDEVPLDVKMSAWSPFIPVDPENSGLPTAIIEWTLDNPGKEPVEYSVAFAMGNPFGTGELKQPDQRQGYTLSPIIGKDWKGFAYKPMNESRMLPDQGEFRISFPAESNFSLPLYRGSWWDDAHIFWEDFSEDGQLEFHSDSVVIESGSKLAASVNISGTLGAGESVTLPFIFTWFVPDRKLESTMSLGNKKVEGAIVRNYYATRFGSMDSLSAYVLENLANLRSKTREFSHAMISSSVPKEILDAAISNLSSLKTNLLMQDEQGNIHGFQGLGNDFGCCPGNNTGVWNYAQTMAAVFPSLERNMRSTSYTNATHWNGYQSFRTVFPLGDFWFKNIAADGQMGNILRVYREWKMSGDDRWLGNIWPDVKNTLEFAWKGTGDLPDEFEWMRNCPLPWDPAKEGVLRGEQHTAYDIKLFGPNMLTGSLYLGALKAMSEMAIAMNEPQKSIEYEEIFRKGSSTYMELLWNGSYFVQEVEVIPGVDIPEGLRSPPGSEGKVVPKYQYAQACHSDQLLGQYLAFVSGMGYLLDSAVVRQTLLSIFENNFQQEMRKFSNLQRIYAANGESGLVLCTWPNGKKPLLPFVHSDEVWSGVEYQVAASCIFAGLLDEGLRITQSVRSRYTGNNRNPFSEIESGGHSARALSSWSVYQALAGYFWDGGKKRMQFSPADDVLPQRFFWSTSTGWGTFKASRASIELKCMHGELSLNKLELKGKSFFVFREFNANYPLEISYAGNTLHLDFKEEIVLSEEDEFRLEIP